VGSTSGFREGLPSFNVVVIFDVRYNQSLTMKGYLPWLGVAAITAAVVVLLVEYTAIPIEKRAVVTDSDTTGLSGGTGNSAKPTSGSDDYSALIRRFGPPDSDDSTQYDKPRPPMVTRWIEYEPEHVRIVFVPIARVGEPPPYVGWKVFAFIDTKAERTLTRDEAERRLQGRIKAGR
jgi:hypothetical protein